MSLQSVIRPYGEINRKTTEVYGQGPTILRIGNGGAGPTGIIAAISHAYLATHAPESSITWTYNISRNTHLALLNDLVDITLTYDRALEDIADKEGWSITVACTFHDHFVLVGPASDPVGLRHAPDISRGLALIAEAGRTGQAHWHSRDDRSATMVKEHMLWERVDLRPWNDPNAPGWYHKNPCSPAEALVAANAAGAYCLTDRATLLRQTARQTIQDATVFFEPTSAEDFLLNSCFVCKATKSSADSHVPIQRFLDFLLGEPGQEILRRFGEQEAGLPFFAPAADGYCRRLLRDGRPEGGRWQQL